MPRRLTVTFGTSCWTNIVSLALQSYPLETGGILVGAWSGNSAEVTEVIGPGPRASHARKTFEPDQDWQVTEMARLWKGSRDRAGYLGDWHTHPNGRPRLSKDDRDTARLIAASPGARCPRPILAVVALFDDGRVRPYAEVLAEGQLRPAKLIISPLLIAALAPHTVEFGGVPPCDSKDRGIGPGSTPRGDQGPLVPE